MLGHARSRAPPHELIAVRAPYEPEPRRDKQTLRKEALMRQFPGGAPVENIEIPAKVAFDMDAMQGVIRDVAGRLGHEGCHSGFDFRFRHALDYVVNVQGEVQEAGFRVTGAK